MQPTTYAYDVFGNLTTVTQGSQTRTFTHDSLSRLRAAVNPESGSISYKYDGNGNVVVKTDARGVSTHFQYDSVNRITRRWYNGSNSISETTHNSPALPSGVGATDEARFYYNSHLYSLTASLIKEQFGTTTSIYNKLFYNSRGQLAEIRVSTSYTGPSDTDWNRGAIINNYSDQCSGTCSESGMTDNNGNLKVKEIYIPNEGQPGYTMRSQQYEYDSLNRLLSDREVMNNQEQWKQQFTYDRWGNRTINISATYGTGIYNKAFTVNTSNNRLGVPAGQSGVMNYDAVGNLTNDTYTGAVYRTYDAENKVVLDGNNQEQLYGGAAAADPALWGVYIREALGNYHFAMSARKTNGGAYSTVRGNTVLTSGTWYYVTYSSNGSAWKIRVNGATAETLTNVLGTNTGDWIGDITPTTPDKSDIGAVYAGGAYSSVNFWHGILDEVPLSNVECSDDWIATEYNNQSSPSTFYTISSATSLSLSSQVSWLVTDHLGTPRMIIDQTGNLANVKRHDYMPFGEELFAGTASRSATQGYGCTSGGQGCTGDKVRQQFTQKERDIETGMDHFLARNYLSTQERFNSVDPLFASAVPELPQSWNRYAHVVNNPLKFIDSRGRNIDLTGAGAQDLIDLEKKTRP